jgi:hypothetical protein
VIQQLAHLVAPRIRHAASRSRAGCVAIMRLRVLLVGLLLMLHLVGNRRRLPLSQGELLREALAVLESRRGSRADGVGGEGGGGGGSLRQELLLGLLLELEQGLLLLLLLLLLELLEELLLGLREDLTLVEGLRLAGLGEGARGGCGVQLLRADDRVGTTSRAGVGRDQIHAVPDGDERVLLHLAQNLSHTKKNINYHLTSTKNCI